MKSDLEIAKEAKLDKIADIAFKLGIENNIELYGDYKAKIDLEVMNSNKADGKLILVTSITPTKAGEGKTTVTVGLGQGLTSIGEQAIIALREPSLGPVMGIKGGATGGGYSQVLPMEDINLHFTGDMHAITSANNTLCALIDNHIYHGNGLNIDPHKILFKRCIDINDRALRHAKVNTGFEIDGKYRDEEFTITAASEIMAILCLATSYDDLKVRLGKILIAYNIFDEPIYAKELGGIGALMVLLKDAFKPNLVQTLNGTPAIIHGGPFANIAHGCNSIVGTKTALKLADYVVTEAGFGADMGAEKFFNIKCTQGDLLPECVVIVATVRALKMHGEADKENNGDTGSSLLLGTKQLEKHIESIKHYRVPYVVALNYFEQDTPEELRILKDWCETNSHPFVVDRGYYTDNNQGSDNLADKVIEIIEENASNYWGFEPLYTHYYPYKHNISFIATRMYGAKDVIYSNKAKEALDKIEKMGHWHLPVCMAKTPASLSGDPWVQGTPKDFTIEITDIKLASGAGFIICYVNNVLTMPGLSKAPNAFKMDLDSEGNYIGLN